MTDCGCLPSYSGPVGCDLASMPELYVYDAEEWPTLSAQERVRRCRLWAAEARHHALKSAGSARELFVSIANGWDKLAEEIEDQERTKRSQ